MKTLLWISSLTAIIAVTVFADGTNVPAATPPPANRQQAFQHARMAIVAQKLGLTEDQRTKAKTIHSQTAETVKAIQANPALTPEQKQAQVDAARKTARDQFQALLTPEQQTQFAEIKRHPLELNVMANHRMRMEMVARRLEITPEQKAKIHEIQSRTMAAVKPLWTDTTLTPEQKQAKTRELRQAARTEVQSLLTPEQQEKLNRIRQHLLAPLGPLG